MRTFLCYSKPIFSIPHWPRIKNTKQKLMVYGGYSKFAVKRALDRFQPRRMRRLRFKLRHNIKLLLRRLRLRLRHNNSLLHNRLLLLLLRRLIAHEACNSP